MEQDSISPEGISLNEENEGVLEEVLGEILESVDVESIDFEELYEIPENYTSVELPDLDFDYSFELEGTALIERRTYEAIAPPADFKRVPERLIPDDGRVHLLQSVPSTKERSGYCHSFDGDPENVEHLLDIVREDGKILEEYATRLSRERKRPVLVLCNARAGTLLYYPLRRSLAKIVEDEERTAFAQDVWKHKSQERKGLFRNGKPSTLVALFKAAAEQMGEGNIESFVHPLKNIKISSMHRENDDQKVVAQPYDVDSLIAEGVADIIFADYSTGVIPGSFGGKYLDNPRRSGFSGWIRDVTPRMKVIKASRRREGWESTPSPEEAIDSVRSVRRPVALAINMLNEGQVYALVDNHPELLGRFGYEMGSDHDKNLEYEPCIVETNKGEMDLSQFVKGFLQEAPQ